MIPRMECDHCGGTGNQVHWTKSSGQKKPCPTCSGTGLVPPPGLEPGPLSRPHFECGASTNSTKGADRDGLYHGLAYPRKEEGHRTDDVSPRQYPITGWTTVWARPDYWPKCFHETCKRLLPLMADIRLTNGWGVVSYYDDRGFFYLQVRSFDAACNVSGQKISWSGRKWLISPHMTDAEIIQTALKAVLTAAEHEIREQFLYKGQPVFDPHYDIMKLVELRSAEDALSVRTEGATVSSHDDLAEDPIHSGDARERGSSASGAVPAGEPAGLLMDSREEDPWSQGWNYDSASAC